MQDYILHWTGLSIGPKIDERSLLCALTGEGGGGSKMPKALSFGAIRRDNDLIAIVGLPATVELEMHEGSEFRLDDLLVILGGCQTTCLRLRSSIW